MIKEAERERESANELKTKITAHDKELQKNKAASLIYVLNNIDKASKRESITPTKKLNVSKYSSLLKLNKSFEKKKMEKNSVKMNNSIWDDKDNMLEEKLNPSNEVPPIPITGSSITPLPPPISNNTTGNVHISPPTSVSSINNSLETSKKVVLRGRKSSTETNVVNNITENIEKLDPKVEDVSVNKIPNITLSDTVVEANEIKSTPTILDRTIPRVVPRRKSQETSTLDTS